MGISGSEESLGCFAIQIKKINSADADLLPVKGAETE